jgi:hypothetical protein
MSVPLQTAERLRDAAQIPHNQPGDPLLTLPRLYPVSIVVVPGLCLRTLCDWLIRHGVQPSGALTTCRDRSLRGGILARQGSALIFLDAEDTADEQRYAAAHEGGHFLQDHLYPRQEIIRRLGEQVRPILDGLRPPTLAERVDALLARTSLYQHTHLMDRESGTFPLPPEIATIEANADAFACELLAPIAAIEQLFAWTDDRPECQKLLCQQLVTEYGLPPRYAAAYAEQLAVRYAPPPTSWRHLRLI